MLKIEIPNDFIPERSYIIDRFFNEFIGIDYQLNISKCHDYSILLENGHKLIIEDHFFSGIDKSIGYLHEKNIPSSVKLVKNDFTIENDMVCIYGNEELMIDTTCIRSGVDIFASAFFMLTRWEEYVNKTREQHNRFPATASLAYKNNFLHRPIVNEYVEFLWKMLQFLGCAQQRKNKKSEVIVTHDIDGINFWHGWKHVVRTMVGDVLKRRDFNLARERLVEYWQISQRKIKDPWDSFHCLMDKSEAARVKSHFYFMSGGNSSVDNRYRIDELKTKNILADIQKREHIIGFHGSYNSYNDPQQWRLEKELLEHTAGIGVTEGRQHYLRFEVPTTWQIYEDNHMKYDLSCGYHDCEGFRCGTGDEFSVFNILTRKQLCLKERPLIFMDTTFITYKINNPTKDVSERLQYFCEVSSRLCSKLVILLHNCNVKKYGNTFYEKLLQDE